MLNDTLTERTDGKVYVCKYGPNYGQNADLCWIGSFERSVIEQRGFDVTSLSLAEQLKASRTAMEELTTEQKRLLTEASRVSGKTLYLSF